MAAVDLSAVVSFPTTFQATLGSANTAREIILPSRPGELTITFRPLTTAASLATDPTNADAGALVGAAFPLAAGVNDTRQIGNSRPASLFLFSATGSQVVDGIIERVSGR